VYTYFRVPEPQGRTFAELDVLFEQKVSARKFASTEVDIFHDELGSAVMSKYQHQLHEKHTEKA
jgi:MFS transporter, SP family, general alpha glucoside:H+ symporter